MTALLNPFILGNGATAPVSLSAPKLADFPLEVESGQNPDGTFTDSAFTGGLHIVGGHTGGSSGNLSMRLRPQTRLSSGTLRVEFHFQADHADQSDNAGIILYNRSTGKTVRALINGSEDYQIVKSTAVEAGPFSFDGNYAVADRSYGDFAHFFGAVELDDDGALRFYETVNGVDTLIATTTEADHLGSLSHVGFCAQMRRSSGSRSSVTAWAMKVIEDGVTALEREVTPPTVPDAGNADLLDLALDGDIVDRSTALRGLPYAVGASVSFTTAEKKFGSGALEFDGSPDNIGVRYEENGTDWEMSDGKVFECFFRLTSFGGETERAIFGTRGGVGTRPDGGWFLQVRDISGTFRLRFLWWTAGGSFQNPGNITSVAISFNTWYHFAVQEDGADTKVWLDGTLVSTLSGVNVPGNGPFQIGAVPGTTDAAFIGQIDGVRVDGSGTRDPSVVPTS